MPSPSPTVELTDEEQALLDRHFSFYEDLESGARVPTTEAQEHFVEVIRGKARAQTVHEMAYAKHMRLRAQDQEYRYAQREESREYLEAGREEWFSREDHRKLRSRQFADLRKRSRGDD